MVLPKYIETSWCGEGMGVLEFYHDTVEEVSDHTTSAATTEASEDSTKANDGVITCYISSVHIKEYEEKYEESEDTNIWPDSEKFANIGPEEFICPPDLTEEDWEAWLEFWANWKGTYVPLAWVHKNREKCPTKYIEWHDSYIQNDPSAVAVITDGLFDVEGEEEHEEGTNFEGSSDHNSDAELEQDEWDFGEPFQQFSVARYWVHFRAFLYSYNIKPSEKMVTFFEENGVTFGERASEYANLNPVPDFMQDDKEVITSPQKSVSEVEEDESLGNVGKGEGSLGNVVNEEDSLGNEMQSGDLDTVSGIEAAERSSAICDEVNSCEETAAQSESEGRDKIGMKRHQECANEEEPDKNKVSESAVNQSKRMKPNPLLEKNRIAAKKPVDLGNSSDDGDFDSTFSDFEEVNVESPGNKENIDSKIKHNVESPGNKENIDSKVKNKKKTSKQKKKKMPAPNTQGLAWVLKYLDKDNDKSEENVGDKKDEDESADSPPLEESGNIFSVNESSTGAAKVSPEAMPSLACLPSQNFQFNADRLNLKEESDPSGENYNIQSGFSSRTDSGIDSFVSLAREVDTLASNIAIQSNYSGKGRDSEDEKKEIENENKEIDDENEDFEDEYEKIEDGSKDLEDENEDHEDENEDLEDENKEIEDENVEIEDENVEIEEEYKEVEEEIEEIKSGTDDEDGSRAISEINNSTGFLWYIPSLFPSVKNFLYLCASHLFNIIVPSFIQKSWPLSMGMFDRIPFLGKMLNSRSAMKAKKSKAKPKKIDCQRFLERWLQQVSHITVQPTGSAPFKKFYKYQDERVKTSLYQFLRTARESDGTPYVAIDTLDIQEMDHSEDWRRKHVTFDGDGNPVDTAEYTGYDNTLTQEREKEIWSQMTANCKYASYKISTDEPPPEELPKHLHKYWAQRHRLFLRYDEGIKLDEESWYSVTPEMISAHHAYRCSCDVVVDAFCGAGGNAIQLASMCQEVIAIDIDPVKIELARHNAAVYGVEDRIKFIVGDFFELAPTLKADVVFLSPPWGGTEYLKEKVYNVKALDGVMNCEDLMAAARLVSNDIGLYLPRTSDMSQVIELAGVGGSVDLEYNYMGSKQKALTAYFGDLAYYGQGN